MFLCSASDVWACSEFCQKQSLLIHEHISSSGVGQRQSVSFNNPDQRMGQTALVYLKEFSHNFLKN